MEKVELKYDGSKDARAVENRSGSAIELRSGFKVLCWRIVSDDYEKTLKHHLKTLIREITTGDFNLAVQTGDHPAWDVIITKLDFQSQMKIAQLNQRLADLVKNHAEYDLGSFQRHIQDEKYM